MAELPTDPRPRLPLVRLEHLDELWFQVTGTRCNLRCHHCFISCSPTNDSFGFLTLEQVRRHLRESVTLGVKEYYFTGGEPFLHPDLVAMLEETLQYGPATVLTNATVFRDEWLSRLAVAEQASLYSLEFRVSIDGFSAETNDPIRGEGTFDRAMSGLEKLLDYGFLPLITAVQTWRVEDEGAVVGAFRERLQRVGYAHPRIKLIPTIRLGAEVTRTHGYSSEDRVTAEMLDGYDAGKLLCHHARLVCDRGVYVCPLLLETPRAKLGDSLSESLGPFAITESACATCYQHGAICSNQSR